MTKEEKTIAFLDNAEQERKIKTAIGVAILCVVLVPIVLFVGWAMISVASI